MKTIDPILTIYFSATGNTKYIAEMFSRKMEAKCLSIETEATDDLKNELKSHNTIAFCYPIYGSRAPRIMREFVAKHKGDIEGKKIIILVTQVLFSGDGARVFTDMFNKGAIEVIYAEHFRMPNNVCNIPLLRKPSKRTIQRYITRAEAKMSRTTQNIKEGKIIKRGFSRFSKLIGNIQGQPWQGNTRAEIHKQGRLRTMEQRAKTGVRIRKECNACGLCVNICPMKNLENHNSKIVQKNNCIICYRCVNQCPRKAITVLFHIRPKWQYDGI